MASLYKRGKRYWISYYVQGKLIQKSLETTSERVALAKKRQIEYESSLGNLLLATETPLVPLLEAFCKHLEATRTYKSCKNDMSRLRVFFGPICSQLQVRTTGDKAKDKYKDAHIRGVILEEITPEVINRFLADRVERDGWSPKTANLLRQILHKLFSYAVSHHGFLPRDRRHPNPVSAVPKFVESAPRIRFLTLQDISTQLSALSGCSSIRAMVATYIYAGLRREEALWLTHDDVDLSARLIRVRAKTIEGEHWQPKTKRNRVVPISSDLYNTLLD